MKVLKLKKKNNNKKEFITVSLVGNSSLNNLLSYFNLFLKGFDIFFH